ncbi:hypothetical protein CANARDRAFT_20665 [[Candida] arabinofermentans NRRL YB-2248]|uniref:Suppressor of forked domain-containing protein n=1 Tax=[Candida] arabinofermentans NRRL YB-2248 TaxID=983967 RepID=A0A1E4T847_9ASCO|nr:hypothetical protein CANARDRAFT_20665 [[Candida] arabinofermentans NRRL YB-2248]
MLLELDNSGLNSKDIPQYWLDLAEQVNKDATNFEKWEELINVSELIPTSNRKYTTKISKLSSAVHKKLLCIAYENVLVQFPYLEQYWCNYAQWLYLFGNTNKATDVYNRAISILPKSIIIWKNYLQFSSETLLSFDQLAPVFEQSRLAVGHHFYSHLIYDQYLDFLKLYNKTKEYHYLVRRVIELPIYHYAKYFREFFNLLEAANLETIKYLISKEDLSKNYQQKWADLIDRPSKNKATIETQTKQQAQPQAQLQQQQQSKSAMTELKIDLRKRYIDLYITTQYYVFQIWQFESKITHPYFHPTSELTRDELNTWNKYLSYLETNNLKVNINSSNQVANSILSSQNQELVVIAYERCLIATAQYPFFWLKFSNFWMNLNMIDKAIDVLIRGIWSCPITHVKLRLRLIDLLILNKDLTNARTVALELCNIYPNLVDAFSKLLQVEQLMWNGQGGSKLIKLVESKLDEVKGTPFEESFDCMFGILLNYSCISISALEKFFEKYVNVKSSKYFWKAYLDFYFLYNQNPEQLQKIIGIAREKQVDSNLLSRYINDIEDVYF